MLATVLTTIIAGFFIFLPNDFYQCVKTGIFALLGGSNIYLGVVTEGYFAEDTTYNALVHTWYFSVICQIYLLFLPACLLLIKTPRWFRISFLTVLAVGSYLLAHLGILEKLYSFDFFENLPRFGYYSTCGRLWEILAGGLVAVLPRPKKGFIRTLLALASCCILLIAMILNRRWGMNILPLLVVAATVSVIAYADKGRIAAWLGFRPLQWIGRASFSVFLVHVPILAFLKYTTFSFGALYFMATTLLILPASYLLYTFIEKKSISARMTCVFWIFIMGGFFCCFTLIPIALILLTYRPFRRSKSQLL